LTKRNIKEHVTLLLTGNTLVKHAGFNRIGATYAFHGNVKGVFVYPLKQDFRKIIGCQKRLFCRTLKYPDHSSAI